MVVATVWILWMIETVIISAPGYEHPGGSGSQSVAAYQSQAECEEAAVKAVDRWMTKTGIADLAHSYRDLDKALKLKTVERTSPKSFTVVFTNGSARTWEHLCRVKLENGAPSKQGEKPAR